MNIILQRKHKPEHQWWSRSSDSQSIIIYWLLHEKKKKDNHGLKLKLALAEDSLSDHTFILFFYKSTPQTKFCYSVLISYIQMSQSLEIVLAHYVHGQT